MIHRSNRSNRAPLAAALALFAAFVLAGTSRLSASLYVVTSAADSGSGSLRESITLANADSSSPHSITISISGAGPHTIALLSALPTITRPTAVTGFIESISGAPGVVLDGTSAGASANGLSFGSNADGSSAAYLAIVNFGGSGISISSDSTSVTHCYLGVGADGATAGANGTGITISGSLATIGNSTSDGNVISGNAGYGLLLTSAANFSAIRGNKIGTNAAGTAAVANGVDGIYSGGSGGVTVGGNTVGQGNVISGNTGMGINLVDGSALWAVQGNLIGTNAAGTAAVPNGTYGINILGDNHLIGSTDPNGRNVISGNGNYGILVYVGSNAADIHGNYIGTNAAGTASLGTQSGGIRVTGVVTNCTIGGTSSTFRNVISGNSSYGVSLESDTSGCVVAGNYIGLNAAGDAAVANGKGVDLAGSNNVVGGDTAGERNVISGNTNYGAVFRGATDKIQGNYIGTNPAGTAAIANGSGIRAVGATGGTIGGTNAGEGNVISGNTNNGLSLDGDTSAVSILGNRIGTNAAGTAALANGGGISVGGTGHVVGGASAAARNLISGNGSNGIYVTGSGHQISGNYVGTDAAGTTAIGNGSYGLRADTISGVTIGGGTAAAGNVFAGNSRGVNLGYGSHDNSILNNIIGLDATMTANLADNGTGLEIGDSYDNTIGSPGAGNVVAGMTYQGIGISGVGSHGNTIRGNWIGTNKALAAGLGNGFAGIYDSDASGDTIGGTAAGEGNYIWNNYQFGVRIERGDRMEISGNSIAGNYFGIDVDELGFFPNDGGDGDDGGNQSQNYPLISSAVVNGGSTNVQGLLINEPNTQYRVEFFSSPACGNGGFGEGKTYRGSTQLTTDGGGEAPLAYALPLAVPDAFLTATVTDPLGNTSEFSPCAQVNLGSSPGKFQFDRAAYVGYEGVIPTTQVFVTRALGLSGTATVNFTTSDNGATAGSDYTDSDQTLTFGPWEVVKVVDVPILYDPAPEPFEKVNLALSSPSAGASLGTPATSEIQIYDYVSTDPGLTVDDAFVDEGNSGQKMMTFPVHLTATDHQVKVTYLTEPGTAVAGSDYTDTTNVITFPISATTQTVNVQVPILGDTTVEADEILWLRITTAAAGGNWIAYDAYGRGEIRNDDFSSPPPPNTIFADSFEIGGSGLWSSTTP